LELVLQSAGFSATCVVDGAAAIAHLAERTPDLILLDASMPQLDAFELLRRVRANPRTAALPVILFSPTPDPAIRERALNAGAQECWSKEGFDYASLPQRLTSHLRS
jgi:CheY-like chemotaxis protein